MEKTTIDKRRENKEPIPYRIFKGLNGKFGTLRFTLKKAYSDFKRDEGCVFVDMAPTSGKNVYDWDKKIAMALGLSDISKIVMMLRNPREYRDDSKKGAFINIFHDKGMGTDQRGKETAILNIDKYDDKDNFFFTMVKNKDGVENRVSIPVSKEEVIVIGTLLQHAIVEILSWH